MTPGWERGAGVGAWHRGHGWGFCSIRSLASACRRRVAPLLVQFPPFGGGEVAVRGGEAPASQTPSATNADNGAMRARWPALWTQRCLDGRPPTRRAFGGIHAPTMKQPPSMLIVTRQHTGKSLRNQHAMSFNQQKSGWHPAQRPRATRRRRRGKAYRPESFTDEVSVERSMGRARHTIARSLCAHESFVGIIHVMSRVDVR